MNQFQALEVLKRRVSRKPIPKLTAGQRMAARRVVSSKSSHSFQARASMLKKSTNPFEGLR